MKGCDRKYKKKQRCVPKGAIGRTMINLDEIKITPRDQHVLSLLAQGCSNKEIASQLNIGTPEQLVKNYLRATFDKLGVWSWRGAGR